MSTSKLGCAFVMALILLPPAVCDAATIVQGAADDYVWFQAGQYHDLSNPGTSVVTDNADGTLTTTAQGDESSLVTYQIEFVDAPADYYLYFNIFQDPDDSVFVNHATGFNNAPGNSDDERWNSLEDGWNGLVENAGSGVDDDRSNYAVAPGTPPYGWNVDGPGVKSFIVRNREDGFHWKDFVFSKQNNLSRVELDAIMGIEPPEPLKPVSPVAFSYNSATGPGTISGMLDTTGAGGTGDVLFTGTMPVPTTVDPNPDLTPAGSIGTITENTGSHNEDGKTAGVSWAGKGPVTLTGTDGVNNYSVDVELIFGPSGDDGYNDPYEDRLSSYHPESGEFFDYEWLIKISDDALAEQGGDAVSTGVDDDHPRMAVFYGVGREEANGLAHRLTQNEEQFNVGADAYENTDNTKGDGERWSKFAAYQPLGLYYGWRDRDTLSDGSFQVDSISFSGNLPVDLDMMTSEPVPEPSTLVLVAIALLGLALYGRRRRA